MGKEINSNEVYRSWDDIIGNSDAKEAAMEAATSGEVFRLLIKGAVGTGKTTLANMLTRRWLCDHPKGYEPCWGCAWCGDHYLSYGEGELHMQAIRGFQGHTRGYDYINVRGRNVADIRDAFHEASQRTDTLLLHLEEATDLGIRGSGEEWTRTLDFLADKRVSIIATGISSHDLDAQFERRFVVVRTAMPTQEEILHWLDREFASRRLTPESPQVFEQLAYRSQGIVGFLRQALNRFALRKRKQVTLLDVYDWTVPEVIDPWME